MSNEDLNPHQHLIVLAYAHWKAGEGSNWDTNLGYSPYVCDAIRKVESKAPVSPADTDRASYEVREFIMTCLNGHGTVQEFLGLPEYGRRRWYELGRDPRAMDFRRGLWKQLAEHYNVIL